MFNHEKMNKMSCLNRILTRVGPRILLVIVALLAVLWLQLPRLMDPFQVDEDFRSFYWMNKFQDPELFPKDQLRGKQYTTIYLPWGELPLYFYSLGYDLLFYIASFVVTPVLFSKLLPFFVMPATVWYLFEYGKMVRGRRTGVVLASGFLFLNLASPTSLTILSGLQRSLATPLIIALLYYLRRGQSRSVAIVVFLSAWIYPPIFLLGLATWSLSALKVEWRPRIRLSLSRDEMVLIIVAFLLGALILSPVLFLQLKRAASGQGATGISYKHLWENPQYQQGGRAQLFQIFPLVGRGGLVNKALDAAHLLVLLLIGGLMYWGKGKQVFDLPRELWSLLWASLLMFVLAWGAVLFTNSFLLYLPSRYTRVGLFLFLLFFVCLQSIKALPAIAATFHHKRRSVVWLVLGVEGGLAWLISHTPPEQTNPFLGVNSRLLLLIAAFALGILGVAKLIKRVPYSVANERPFVQTPAYRAFIAAGMMIGLVGWGVYARRAGNVSVLNLSLEERAMLTFVQTLPKDALFAGTPCALDNVPLFGKREIVFSCETLSQDQALTREALNAYYAEDAVTVLNFCENYNVAYLILRNEAYTDDYLAKRWIFFPPYNDEIFSMVQERSVFILANVPDSAKLFQDGDWSIVPCRASILDGL